MNRRGFLKRALAAGLVPTLAPLLRSPVFAAPSLDERRFQGRAVFDRLLRTARREHWAKRPIGVVVADVALALRGTPYVAATLELDDDREVCSVDFLGLDCVTLFETSLDFARMLKRGGRTPDALLAEIARTRYRGGVVGDYTSRLHYTTDWFFDNDARGNVALITRDLSGAEPFTGTVSFMSTHPQAYRQLKAHPELVPTIAAIEARINARSMMYVPKAKVAAAEPMLRTGDIIGITTTIPGIDCSHTGLCYRDETQVLRYLHASSDQHQVVLDAELSEYLARIPKHTGIMVARPLELDAERRG